MSTMFTGRRIAVLSALLALLAGAACSQGQGDGPIREAIRDRLRGGDEANVQAESGMQLINISHGGQERSYYASVPPGGGNGLPVVMVFHGGEGDPTDAAAASGLGGSGAGRNFVALFPSSGNSQWNDGRNETANGRDDVGFALAVLSDAVSRFGVDPSRAFAAGASNGGLFTERLACEASGTFAAFAVIAATMPADLAERCRPAAPVPMIFFMGTGDRLMPYEGGEIASMPMLGVGVGGTVYSAQQTQDFWARQNSCGSGRTEQLPDTTNDGTTAEVTRYDCSGGANLTFVTIEGGGHNWPGATAMAARRLSGTVSQDVDATSRMLGFFQRYGL
ncbi:alpha/beta hydrolase family esterase [Pseudoroseicyclus sp. H15]